MSITVPMEGFGNFLPLNFDVKSYATKEELQESAPKENSIGIISSQKITGWFIDPANPFLTATEIYTADGLKTGYYLDQTGAEKTGSGVSVTQNLPLPSGAVSITISACDTETTNRYHAFYDADDTLISTTIRKTGRKTYPVPVGAKSVRVTVLDDDDDSVLTNHIVAEEGQVWISTGKESVNAFNAIKKNSLRVCPLAAQQYINGELVNVTAMSYQGGAWSEWWVGQLFQDGNSFENITGGWEPLGWSANDNWRGTAPTVAMGESMSMSSTQSSGNHSGGQITKNPVALKGWNRLQIKCNAVSVSKATRYESGLMMALVSTKAGDDYIEESRVAYATVRASTSAFSETNVVAEIPLEGFNGDDDEYYIFVYLKNAPDGTSTTAAADIGEILLLK